MWHLLRLRDSPPGRRAVTWNCRQNRMSGTPPQAAAGSAMARCSTSAHGDAWAARWAEGTMARGRRGWKANGGRPGAASKHGVRNRSLPGSRALALPSAFHNPRSWWRRAESNRRPRGTPRSVYERSLRFEFRVTGSHRQDPQTLGRFISPGGPRAQTSQAIRLWSHPLRSHRMGTGRMAALRQRARDCSRRLFVLPLFTRPAAPRLANSVLFAPVETRRPQSVSRRRCFRPARVSQRHYTTVHPLTQTLVAQISAFSLLRAGHRRPARAASLPQPHRACPPRAAPASATPPGLGTGRPAPLTVTDLFY